MKQKRAREIGKEGERERVCLHVHLNYLSFLKKNKNVSLLLLIFHVQGRWEKMKGSIVDLS